MVSCWVSAVLSRICSVMSGGVNLLADFSLDSRLISVIPSLSDNTPLACDPMKLSSDVDRWSCSSELDMWGLLVALAS